MSKRSIRKKRHRPRLYRYSAIEIFVDGVRLEGVTDVTWKANEDEPKGYLR